MVTEFQWDSRLNTVLTSPISIICLLGMMEKNDGRKSKFYEEIATKARAEFLVERVNQCNDLAKIAKEVGSHLKRSAMTSWRYGDEGIVE